MTYTADEFKNSRFATHPDGRIAARNWYGDDGPWWARMPAGNWMGRSDSLMAADGWAPFPEPRPLPVEVTDEMVGRGMEGWNSAEGQTFVTAIRAVLTAALAAAPTTDEDVHVAGSRASLGSLVEQVRDGGSRCQVDRVVIAPCDEYGSTVTELGLYAERDHFHEVANTFRAKFNEADARAEKAEARVAELEAMTPSPTAARDLLAMLPDLCYEPEGDAIPARAGYVVTRGGAVTNVTPLGPVRPVQAEPGDFRYLLLDPPAPVTPEWHSARIVEATCRGHVGQWARTATDDLWVSLDGAPREAYTPDLSDVTVVVPEEVEA